MLTVKIDATKNEMISHSSSKNVPALEVWKFIYVKNPMRVIFFGGVFLVFVFFNILTHFGEVLSKYFIMCFGIKEVMMLPICNPRQSGSRKQRRRS